MLAFFYFEFEGEDREFSVEFKGSFFYKIYLNPITMSPFSKIMFCFTIKKPKFNFITN